MGMGTIDMLAADRLARARVHRRVSLAVGMHVLGDSRRPRDARRGSRDAARHARTMTNRPQFVGTSLAVFQLGAALTLLVGAFLLVGTLRHLSAVPLGFDATRAVRLHACSPRRSATTRRESLAYLEEFQRRLRPVPGVESVTAGRAAPFLGSGRSSTRIKSAEADPQARPLEPATTMSSIPRYFSTLAHSA